MEKKIYFYLSIIFIFTFFKTYASDEHQIGLSNWNASILLQETVRHPAKTAVLIIAPPTMGNCFISNRWKIGKKVWEQYMNSHPNVDCYFLQTTYPDPSKDEQVWLEGNTIYIGDQWYQIHHSDRILHKTIVAMEWLLSHNNYTHFIRTNLNAFFNLKNVNEYMETHHQSFYTTPLWQSAWYTIGYVILHTTDVAEHMVKEYRRLEADDIELISPNHADDGALTSLATGVWPYDNPHPFTCCPTLPFGVRQLMSYDSFAPKRISQYGVLLTPPITYKKALNICERAGLNKIIYRTNGDLSLSEIAELYQYLMKTNYPELPCIDLLEYSENLPKN